MIFPHQFTYIVPAVSTDIFHNASRDYSGTVSGPVAGWLQQNSRNELRLEGRDPAVGGWTLFTLTSLNRYDRVLWSGFIFEVEGQPNPLYTPAGLHHYEVSLYTVEG